MAFCSGAVAFAGLASAAASPSANYSEYVGCTNTHFSPQLQLLFPQWCSLTGIELICEWETTM